MTAFISLAVLVQFTNPVMFFFFKYNLYVLMGIVQRDGRKWWLQMSGLRMFFIFYKFIIK